MSNNIEADTGEKQTSSDVMSSSEQLRVRHGKLTERSVIELLFSGYTTGMDGTLTCSQNSIIKTLRFKSGKLLDARSNDPQDSSAWILHEMGRLEGDFQNDYEEIKDNDKISTMNLLSQQIKKGVMQPSEIDEFMHRRVRRILHDLMSWREGEYVLELSKIPRADPPLKVHRSIPEMILREIKTAADPVGLEELIGNPSTMVLTITDNQDVKANVRLTAIEQRIFKSIRKSREIREIAMFEGLGIELTVRILLGLAAVNLIKVPYRELFTSQKSEVETKVTKVTTSHKSRVVESSPKPKPAPPKPKPPVKEVITTLDQDLLDSFEVQGAAIKTGNYADEKARKYLIEKLQLGFLWNPYMILDVETYSKYEDIEKAYRTEMDKVTKFGDFVSKTTLDYQASYLTLLAEARTVLLSETLRRRFDSIAAIIDVEKKLKTARKIHKKSLEAFKDKRLAMAILNLKFAIFLDPKYREYQYKLIYVMIQNRRLWAMARLLQMECLENFGTNANIVALSGLIYHKTGDRVKARVEYVKALKIDPSQDLARQGLEIIDKTP